MTSTKPKEEAEDPWGFQPDPISGVAWSTRESKDDQSFIEIGKGKVELGFLEPRDDEDPYYYYGLDLVRVDLDGTLVHAQLDYDSDAPPDRKVYWRTIRRASVPPTVATVDTLTFHGSALGPGVGSPNVRCHGRAVWRAYVDAHACALATPLPHLGGVVVPTVKPTVFVNGFPIARGGDVVMEALGGPNPIIDGGNVLAGEPAPPTITIDPEPQYDDEEDGVLTRARKWIIKGHARAKGDIDIGAVEGQARGGYGAKFLDAPFWMFKGPHADADGKGRAAEGSLDVELGVTFFDRWTFTPIDFNQQFATVGARVAADIMYDPSLGIPHGHADVDLEPGYRRSGDDE